MDEIIGKARTLREALAMARAVMAGVKPEPRDAEGKRPKLEVERLWAELVRTRDVAKANEILSAMRVHGEE